MPLVLALQSSPAKPHSIDLASLYEMVLDGGPLMYPIGLCSVIALAFVVERFTRLRSTSIGTRRFAGDVLEIVKAQGSQPALEVCQQNPTPLSRILEAGLLHHTGPFLEMEKVVEDTGRREVKRLSAGLRPLVVVAMIAPLLGLLGTVWGMIGTFTNIAVQDGLGKPELLAGGISQALITTAAGLTVAIPTQAAYYYFKSRIDRFARLAEDTHAAMWGLLNAKGAQ
ncbi:MAG: MotA/TolQ/ExbB proton channel family protein [Planctomycetes bacterium]|nr:MotA/TolQ/ExbB proton channel family protein [Planctomycetota bacterium]HRV81348.1 MotA/TolQ/ExbB proton channel family protein [Planctomycetota bacterium]